MTALVDSKTRAVLKSKLLMRVASRLHGVDGENEEIQTHFGAALHRHTWIIDTLIRVCCLQTATFLTLTPSSAKTYILRWQQEG